MIEHLAASWRHLWVTKAPIYTDMESISVSSDLYKKLQEYATSVDRPLEQVAEEALSRSAVSAAAATDCAAAAHAAAAAA